MCNVGDGGNRSKLKTSAERGVPNAIHVFGVILAGFVRNLGVRLSYFWVTNELKRQIPVAAPEK